MNGLTNGYYQPCCYPDCPACACPGYNYCEYHINVIMNQQPSGSRSIDIPRLIRDASRILKIYFKSL